MGSAVASHGSLIATEANPIVAGTFVDIAELMNDPFSLGWSRDSGDATPHNDTIDTKIVSPVHKRDPIPIEGNFLYAGATQDHLTGLQKHFDSNTKFGLMFKGPTWSTGVDEIICSGQLIAFERSAGKDAGSYSFSAMFEASGLMIVDTVTMGSIG